ncbi:MAG: 30S ribosomal protein S24e [Aigarchaeota archaeon]|nr:30S ribosomal protein S24e [Candidatus Wolframiiraptor gerlachensis]
MNLEIIKDRKNPLLGRREIEAIIIYESGTPKRDEVREEIAKRYNVEKERVIIEKMESLFGTRKARAHIHIYDSVEYAKMYERKQILKKHGLLVEVKQAG